MRLWQELHKGFARWAASVSRKEGARFVTPRTASSSGGIFGGGGGGGVPRMLSRMKSPRLTGEVRVGFEVTASTVPSVRMPPRRDFRAADTTRRISSPITFVIP